MALTGMLNTPYAGIWPLSADHDDAVQIKFQSGRAPQVGCFTVLLEKSFVYLKKRNPIIQQR